MEFMLNTQESKVEKGNQPRDSFQFGFCPLHFTQATAQKLLTISQLLSLRGFIVASFDMTALPTLTLLSTLTFPIFIRTFSNECFKV
ncbi:Hypothetical predicted protein [Podarcis lilfordi]|uniref:Uncharacterized protein n=1 Tax=Podarcis lilfordi TaxID=74358 RepID=A0AA35P7V2_9SAUR|nr:Hypothetical predicted protein [Podarcis lilfordi]